MNSSLTPVQKSCPIRNTVNQTNGVKCARQSSDQWIEFLSKLSLVSGSNTRLDDFDFENWAEEVRFQLVQALRSRYRSASEK